MIRPSSSASTALHALRRRLFPRPMPGHDLPDADERGPSVDAAGTHARQPHRRGVCAEPSTPAQAAAVARPDDRCPLCRRRPREGRLPRVDAVQARRAGRPHFPPQPALVAWACSPIGAGRPACGRPRQPGVRGRDRAPGRGAPRPTSPAFPEQGCQEPCDRASMRCARRGAPRSAMSCEAGASKPAATRAHRSRAVANVMKAVASASRLACALPSGHGVLACAPPVQSA